MLFFSRKRTSDNCSLASVGKSSKSSTETRAQESGRMSAASRRLRLPFGGTMPRTAAASFSGSRMLSRRGDTEMTPGSSARKSTSRCLPVRAIAMPASESSKARAGGGSRQRAERVIEQERRRQKAKGKKQKAKAGSVRGAFLPFVFCLLSFALSFLAFDEGDFVDLLQSGRSLLHFEQRRLPQERHALFAGQALDLRRRALIENHFADALGQVEELMDGGAPAETSAAALEAPGAFEHGDVAPLGGIQAALDQVRIGIPYRLAAEIADHAHQALRQDAVERRNEIVRLDAHVEESAQHVEHVIGMH